MVVNLDRLSRQGCLPTRLTSQSLIACSCQCLSHQTFCPKTRRTLRLSRQWILMIGLSLKQKSSFCFSHRKKKKQQGKPKSLIGLLLRSSQTDLKGSGNGESSTWSAPRR